MFKNLNLLYRLGLTDSLSTYDAFKLQIVNRLAVLCIGVALVLISINIVFQNYVGIAIDFLAVVLVAFPVLLFNKLRRYQLSIYLFLAGFHIALIAGTYHTILEGRQNGVEYLFVPGVIAIIILVNGIGQYISVFLNFLALTYLNYIRFEHLDEGELATYVRLIMILFAAYLMVYFFVVNFKNQLFKILEKTERLNTDLLDKEEALLDSNKSKDRLFSIIAHDLRAPLTSVHGLLEPEIIQSMDKDEYLNYANTVRTKVDVLQYTMNGLLDWAKSQLDSLTIEPEIVDVADEIQRISELFLSSMEAKNISWEYEPNDETVYADRNHFIIILRNIIHNAIKFSTQGGHVEITTENDGEGLCISIEDAGKGIDKETCDRILKGQLNESSFGTAGETGSGIGLSFCHELLRKNKGHLAIENASPRGSIFKVWLPANK